MSTPHYTSELSHFNEKMGNKLKVMKFEKKELSLLTDNNTVYKE